jgi:CheY-like chemotaxis protein
LNEKGIKMFIKEWQVLLVDDDTDLLSVSKLAMKNFQVYGLPLRILTATSKAEAIEVLKSTARAAGPMIPVVFIDVVMETDTAGLELCEYIRETMENKNVQLFIRTGQPGVAPERTVIDRYDINGYFTKVEATEDKLYTLVKSGIRQVYYTVSATMLSTMTNSLIEAKTQEQMRQILGFFRMNFQSSPSGDKMDAVEMKLGMMVNGELISGDLVPEAKALEQKGGKSLSTTGDKYASDEHNYFMIKVAGTADNAEVYMMAKTTQQVPETTALLFYRFLKAFADLWKQREAVTA